ncbi:hypothetical protein [Psychrobium sp. 1_MG-2023]|uniref:hypothetical protein n=1 Tax=Psychrobium sp. 1_MG-2023 TaxID=3062624 RepID=UPI000C320AAE|nr:hypothetical protein [Psychrobium sp. 1_MG-2023]MDP2562573.1 hypothetical protein [Psychrobium sp. 1_MG-2023]PKF59660.1 hypothetical protein CW748_00160 [Alteromonadales bacterium alter-6D02]
MLAHRNSTLYLFSLLVYWAALPTIAVTPSDVDSNNTAKRAQQKSIEYYQTKISQLELQGGAYSNELGQEVLSLGTAYQTINQHELAVKQFERALHLNRVDEGLYSKNQLPILKKLITSLKAQKRWKLVNNWYHYQYWLHTLNYNVDDDKMLKNMMDFANWNLKSYSQGYSDMPIDHLITAYKTLEKLTELISTKYGETHIENIGALHGLMIANYFVAISSETRAIQTGQENQPMIGPSTIGVLKRKSFRVGKEIVNKEIKILTNQPVKDHLRIVNAMLKLADWELMYGKTQSATKDYHIAYQYAKEHDTNNNFRQQLFSKPIALPNFPQLTLNSSEHLPQQSTSTHQQYVHASFNVTPNGRARAIKVLSAKPKSTSSIRAKAVKFLRASRFRPRINNGLLAATEHTKLHIFVD